MYLLSFSRYVFSQYGLSQSSSLVFDVQNKYIYTNVHKKNSQGSQVQ